MKALFIIMAILIIFVWVKIFEDQSECNNRGGVYAQQAIGYACIIQK